MGQVAITLKVMPDSPETNLEKIKKSVEKLVSGEMEVKSMTEKPVAFGLKQIEVLITMPDKSGGTDEIEEKIRNIKGVASVEPGEITLI